jgi:flagellar hook-associated protein 3 FlgL
VNTNVSLQSDANASIIYLQQQFDQIANLQQQASTGNRINQPSDDPLAIPTVILGQAQDSRYTADLSNITNAQGVLNQSVSTLTSAAQVLDNATQTASQAANGGNDQSTLDTLAQQVDAQINQMLGLANSQSGGNYLFGGTATAAAPFVVSATNSQGLPQTVSYVGSANPVQVIIGQGQTVNTLAPGGQIFQSTGQDVFQALIGLRDDLRNTSGMTSTQQTQAISQQLGALQNARTGLLATVGEQSNTLQNLGSMQSQVQNLQLQTKQIVENTQGADISQVLVQFQAEQNAFQLTLSTTAKMFDQNLLNFLH